MMQASAMRLRRGGAPAQGKPKAGSAFMEAYQSQYTKLFAFVYSRVQNVELARDLVSDVFERAYVNGHSVRDENAYRAWLFMIAKNAIAGHFRRRKREAKSHDRVRDSLVCHEPEIDPEESLLANERLRSMMRHFRCLASRDQELLALKFDAELTHAEIGRVMGLSPINVRVSIFRALKRLRARMEAEEAEAK